MELTSACGEDTLQLIEKNGLAFPFSMYMSFSLVLVVDSEYCTCTPKTQPTLQERVFHCQSARDVKTFLKQML